MNLGFGNNIRSTLAADINATQTTITVMPGAGIQFSKTLLPDSGLVNSSIHGSYYSKLTLTDAQETVFEICHLLSVNQDVLTVIRGMEGTLPKGWSLGDVASNFATRGSENNFVQVEDLQNGRFLSANAGGTENKLTVSIPSMFYINGVSTFNLRYPLSIYPQYNNNGPCTLQLTVSGMVVGTFPILKGNLAALQRGDIIKGLPLLVIFSKDIGAFVAINPGMGLIDDAFTGPLNFLTGGVLQSTKEFIYNNTDFSWYYWTGDYADAGKVVPPDSTPESSGGIGPGKWMNIGDSNAMAVINQYIKDVVSGNATLGYRNYTVKDRLDETISVMALPGVIGDGINDDQPAIQAFVNTMSRGRLYFPGGRVYGFGAPLVIDINSFHIYGDKAYAGGAASQITCLSPGMTAILVRGYGAKINDIGFRGHEVLDDFYAYGQETTCAAISFIRGDGSKDIDSEVDNLQFQHLKYSIYAVGCNLRVTNTLHTSVLHPIEIHQLGDNNEVRGFILNNNRFHHCGGGGDDFTNKWPELLDSKCISIYGQFSRGNEITSNYADAYIRTFFNGQLGRASKLSDNIILRAEGNVFVVDNTELRAANESFEASGNILVNDDPFPSRHSGYMFYLKGVTSANIYGNTGNYIRKGGIYCESVRYSSFTSNVFVNINSNFEQDGVIYDGIYLDEGSTDNYVNGLYLRQTLGLSFRSVINNQGKYNHVMNYGPHGQGTLNATIRGGESITTGMADARRRPRLEFFGDIPPTEGNYQRGDIMWHLSVSSGRYMGHTCTVSGSPGLWVEFAKIEG